MKRFLASAFLSVGMAASFGQGAPSPLGQTISPAAEAAANRAVQGRHDAVKAHNDRRIAKRSGKKAVVKSVAASSP
jgi:hypothetical protein